ncbi:hypothetical protein MFRU_004g03020 [Monilinia fructicola]|uniref:Uncharacterized protein n=1 Tax=Monilinia fructicola TaxID=38448 RepID=A0A5M9JNI5_MONFR|nr:hypothetical protein EYC84_001167 [Monilinia fructicola]KAG4033799.1 hypothetical protein MFRU_004g03020 [Monilinia fructicola]
MATSPTATVPNTPDQDRTDGINNTIGRRQLGGACNYTELNVGTKCGCYEFWAQSQKPITGASLEDGALPRAEVCACGHHLCFHGHKPSQPTEDQRSRALSNVSGLNMDSIARMAQVNCRPSTPQNLVIPEKDTPDVARRIKDSNFQETLQWSRLVQSESNPEDLPPIPSQCFLPSETASMTSSQARRPFNGLGLDTLSHIPRLNTKIQAGQLGKGRPMQAYKTFDGRSIVESPTEVLTTAPSLQATQDFAFQGVPDEHAMDRTLANINIKAQAATLPLHSNRPPSLQAPQTIPVLNAQDDLHVDLDESQGRLFPRLREIVKDYPNTKRNHEDRIEALENASYSNTGYEELQTNIDNHGDRVYELENRVEELEKANAAADESSISNNRAMTESFDSHATKTSSALAANAIDRSDLASRVESLENRLTHIEAVLPPSWARPWEIEVVFLPYGPQMMGIWSTDHSMSQRSRVNSCASEDWTQTQQNVLAAAQASLSEQDYSMSWEKMIMKGNDDDRAHLMPRACSATSKVNERLKSRGLVKVVQIKGPDARDVQVALMTAFGDLPRKLSEDIFSMSKKPLQVPKSMENYLGLRAAWIPLRKLHKTSTLRFLDPSEMVTPALWTVPFLSSSVAMRTKGMRRLYVTQADSYLQHRGHGVSRWTWHKLRQLPRFHDIDAVESHTPEADAAETCWAWDERLDPAQDNNSFASSFMIRLSQEVEDIEIEPTSPSDQFSAIDTSEESSTPTSIAASRVHASSPVKQDRHSFKPLRTASMSALAPLTTSQMGKRRIGSFDREPQSSPVQRVSSLKRRRTSKSPSRPHDTWSIGPPSPMLSAMQEVTDYKRGVTPLAYATPHSNAPYVETSSRTRGSTVHENDDESGIYDTNMDEGYDQNALSDYEKSEDDDTSDQDLHPYDVWEGMADDVPQHDSQSTIKLTVASLSSLEPEIDEEDDSDSSDTPSEYPSTQPVGNYIKGGIFHIHVDEESDDLG